jgi:hypothetical protein
MDSLKQRWIKALKNPFYLGAWVALGLAVYTGFLWLYFFIFAFLAISWYQED